MTALQELSQVLGVELWSAGRIGMSDVAPMYWPQGFREPLGWVVTKHQGWAQYRFRSLELRKSRSLNELAQQMGRRPNLPQLTAADGRRILRLLHAIEEGKTK